MILQLNSEREKKNMNKRQIDTINVSQSCHCFHRVGSYFLLLIVVLLSDVLPAEHVRIKSPLL